MRSERCRNLNAGAQMTGHVVPLLSSLAGAASELSQDFSELRLDLDGRIAAR